MSGPWRSKAAAVIVLFFLGTFAGQIQHLLDGLRGRVERGTQITNEIRATVTTLRQVDTSALEAQIAELQAKLSAGTATPTQVEQLRGLVARLRSVPGPSGTPGPAGAKGESGPPGPAAETTTTTTDPGGTTTTTRPETTTTTRRQPTTTTTRCAVNLLGVKVCR